MMGSCEVSRYNGLLAAGCISLYSSELLLTAIVLLFQYYVAHATFWSLVSDPLRCYPRGYKQNHHTPLLHLDCASQQEAFLSFDRTGPKEVDRMVLYIKTMGPLGTAAMCSSSLQFKWSFTETKLLACLTLSSSSMPAHLQQVMFLSSYHVTAIPNGSELLKTTLAMDWINENLIFRSFFRPGTSLLHYSLAILLGSALLKNILVIGYLVSDVCVLSCLADFTTQILSWVLIFLHRQIRRAHIIWK